jgi:hypothetical protein
MFIGAAAWEHQVSVRIHKPRQYHPSFHVQFAGHAGNLMPSDIAPPAHGENASISDQKSSVANNFDIVQRAPAPRHTAAHRQQLGASGDENCISQSGSIMTHQRGKAIICWERAGDLHQSSLPLGDLASLRAPLV